MILSLYGFLIAVSLVMVVIGLARPEESAQALIGFFFLFLLSLIIINGNLEYQTGEEINTSYAYSGGNLSSTHRTTTNTYNNFDDTTSHRIGYYLAIASAIGFIGVLFSLGKTHWGKE